jgi:hypothetical protein
MPEASRRTYPDLQSGEECSTISGSRNECAGYSAI